MTIEEAKTYFNQCNSRIISVCKDENKYDYEKHEIISNSARKTYEANKLALESLDILGKIRAEINQNAHPIAHGVNNCESGMTLYGILEAIDKKAESEVE